MHSNIHTDPNDILIHLAMLVLPSDLTTTPSVLVNATGLRCPMPLLKVKLALRAIDTGTVLLIADDPNANVDITHFCQKQGLTMRTYIENAQLFIWIEKS